MVSCESSEPLGLFPRLRGFLLVASEEVKLREAEAFLSLSSLFLPLLGVSTGVTLDGVRDNDGVGRSDCNESTTLPSAGIDRSRGTLTPQLRIVCGCFIFDDPAHEKHMS
eukprot:PhM_4_TR5975/c1_g1_i1/m.58596